MTASFNLKMSEVSIIVCALNEEIPAMVATIATETYEVVKGHASCLKHATTTILPMELRCEHGGSRLRLIRERAIY